MKNIEIYAAGQKIKIEVKLPFSTTCIVSIFDDNRFFPDDDAWDLVSREIWSRTDASEKFGIMI